MSVVRTDAARAGIGLGSAIAVAISWSLHKSIVWAAIQGFFPDIDWSIPPHP